MSTTARRKPAQARRAARSRPGGAFTRLDVTVLVISSALLVIGLVMNLSASSVTSAARTGSAFTLFGRQLIYAVAGMAALVACARIDYRRLRGWGYVAVPGVWVLLAATLHPTLGSRVGGATRWLQLGPLTLQPSEGAKLVLILFGADVLARKLNKLDDWKHLMMPFFAVVGCTAVLVLLQPDFGTMVIIAAVSMLLAFLAGARFQLLAGITGAAVLMGIPVMMAESYRRARLFGFINASSDALNTGWQSTQGLVGLGTGGLFGVGLGRSAQKWFYLPNAHTDFILAIMGEEMGLAGTLTVLALFGMLTLVGIRAARQARDPFGFLLASGVTAWIAFQVLVNVGAVTGILPITGVPLPLISSGGSSLLFTLAGLGLVASVARRGTPAPRRVRPRVPGKRSRPARGAAS